MVLQVHMLFMVINLIYYLNRITRLVLTFLFCGSISAQSIDITSDFQKINVTEHMFYADLINDSLSVESVTKFSASDWEKINFQFIQNKRGGDHNLWFRLKLRNLTDARSDLVFAFSTDIEYIEFFILSENDIKSKGVIGRKIKPFDHRFWDKKSSFPIEMEKNEELDVFIKVASSDLYYESFTLSNPNWTIRDARVSSLKDGLLYGLLVSLCIISIVIYLVTLYDLHLFYSLYIVTNTFSLFVANGDFQYLASPGEALGHGVQFCCVLLTSVFFFKFILTYYTGQGLPAIFQKYVNIYAVFVFVCIVFIVIDQYSTISFSHHPFVERLPMLALSVGCFLSVVIIVWFLIIKTSWANCIILLAYGPILFISTLAVLFRNGYVSPLLFPANGYAVAILIEFIFLSLLMGYNVFNSYYEKILLSAQIANQQRELEQAQIIKKTLAEKDTLLREIHHRVKNNLQVISALLTLQAAHLKDAQAKSALQEGQDRVQSMALIHKDLYQHDNLKGVNTKDYFEQLIGNLIQSYSISEEEIEIYTDIEDINLDVDTMIPLGLMINELISNALKHAFHNVTGNKLSVSLHERSDQLLLSIADNGVGVKNIDMMKNQSFGYSLVQSFAHKLDADIQISDNLGLKIEIVIKNYLKV